MNEIIHFTNNPETEGIAEIKVNLNDNAYGIEWANLVREYLKTAYAGESIQCEVEYSGKIYKVLKRDKVTAFYDESGNTLFDVTNDRLQKEYEYTMRNGDNREADKKMDTDMDEAEGDLETGKAQASDEKLEKTSAVYMGIDGALEKLKAELEKTNQKEFAEPVIEYLIERCKESESLAADICQEHKTWEKCYKYIYEEARKKLNSQSGPVRDDVVFEWAEDYFHLDDKAEEEKKAKEAAERKRKEEERKKEAAEQKKADKNNSKQVAEKEEKAEEKAMEPQNHKKNPKDIDGQMDLFSIMGM